MRTAAGMIAILAAFGAHAEEPPPGPYYTLEVIPAAALEGPAVLRSAHQASGIGRTSPGRVSNAALEAQLQARSEQLLAIEADEGENAAALIPELDAMADLYFALEEPLLAMAALERARQLTRRHDGLFNLGQVALLEPLVDVALDTRNLPLFRDYQASVIDLALRNTDDPRVIGILDAAADREVLAALEIIHNGLPPAFQIITDSGGLGRRARVGLPSPRIEALRALRQARRLYNTALRNGVAQGQADLEALFVLEEKIIQSHYLEIAYPAWQRDGGSPTRWDNRFPSGMQALNARLANARNYCRSAAATGAA